MKTAAEMRVSNPKFSIQYILAEIEKSIERVNNDSRTEIRLTAATIHPDRFLWMQAWFGVTPDLNPMIENIVQELLDAGYKVTELYKRKQFVELDIIISWAE
jgi:hypothetical protein